ncbi:hypothetical protein [Wenyingzhuangia sp. IMCC45467]
MGTLILIFTFLIIFPFVFLITFLMKEYGFNKRYSQKSNWKILLYIIGISLIFPIYISLITIYPPDSELISDFEKSTNISLPTTVKIISKKDSPGFNDSARTFTLEFETLFEYNALKTKFNNNYGTKIHSSSYTLKKKYSILYIEFNDENKTVTFESFE